MEKKDILLSFLSKDAGRISEAKQALKDILSAKAGQFKTDASKFVARKLFESAEKIEETHTLNGPFKAGTVVHDAVLGKVGVVGPALSGHLASVHFPDQDPANYGPDQIHRLKQHDAVDNLPDAIAALKGLFHKG